MAKIYKIALIFLFLGMLPAAADAAILYFSPSSGSYNIGQTFTVSVYVSSAEQTMNAASGVISFPPDKLEVNSLSKTGSIFNLWVQEPLFVNLAGTVQFEGIVLNPGFIGSSGKIISVNFKVKSAGTATLFFSSGSALANDGKGTNILTAMNSGVYDLKATVVAPPPSGGEEEYVPLPTPGGTPAAPIVYSLTHPDSEKWYSNNAPEFAWNLPSDVTGVSIYLSKSSASNPGSLPDGLFSSKSYKDIEDGIWYFHIKARNSFGWGPIAHRKVLIDTEKPQLFETKIDNGGDSTNPTPIIHFKAVDYISGIEYYEVKIGEEQDVIPVKVAGTVVSNPYEMPPQSPGKHTIIIKAVDAANNETLSAFDVTIESLEAPVITEIPKIIEIGNALTIKGTSLYPEGTITVFVKKEGEEPVAKDIKTDSQGNWTFVYEKSLDKGTYQVWLEITDSRGAKSYPTEKITIASVLPALIKFGEVAIDYLTIIITLIALIVFLTMIIAYSWYRISLWRKKLRKETKEIEENVVKAFRSLHEEVQEQIEYFDKKRGLNKGEKIVRDKLEGALKISEKLISKEIKDVLKELEK